VSLLKDLANSIEGENRRRETSVYDFSIKFPVIEQIIPELGDTWDFEADIRDSGSLDAVTQAKCFRTRWDMHKVYPSFDTLGRFAIAVANQHPLAGRSKSDGTPDPIPWMIKESWGLIYEKGNYTSNHSHWPSTWGYVYTVKACDSCSPLIFGQMKDKSGWFRPKEGQLLLFPAWLNHHVLEQTCDHPRIKIAGNLDTNWGGHDI
jgi:hypothetical protein